MLDKRWRKQVKETVRKYLPAADFKIFIFGSRALDLHRPFSDVDLGILGPKMIPGNILIRIEEELENSRIPYEIDVVDLKRVSNQFRSLALKKVIYL